MIQKIYQKSFTLITEILKGIEESDSTDLKYFDPSFSKTSKINK